MDLFRQGLGEAGFVKGRMSRSMSESGTFETCRPALKMSVQGRPEVIGLPKMT
jgi:hypothetical protein